MLDHAALNGYPDIGFRVGSTNAITDIGVLGHAVRAAPTVGDALHLLADNLFVLAHGNVINLHTGTDTTLVTWGYTPLYEGLHQQDVELAAAQIRNIVYELSGQTVTPGMVEFAHARQGHARDMEAFFSCRISFGARTNRLHYPQSCLELVNPQSDPSLLKALSFYLQERMKVRSIEDDLLEKTRHFISVSLSHGESDVATIAGKLGVSQRTLQRRLAKQEVVFTDLVNEIRRSNAIEYVQFSEFSLTDVALMLGYSELSAFSRAFRRWTGESPQQVRERSESHETM